MTPCAMWILVRREGEPWIPGRESSSSQMERGVRTGFVSCVACEQTENLQERMVKN